jgi:hypothetical protein
VVSVCVPGLLSLSAHAAGVSGQGTWESTLHGRDLDGNAATYEAYYDSAQDITWLADANKYGEPASTSEVELWVDSLNINGYTGWRLPRVTDTALIGCNFAYDSTDCGYNVDPSTGEMAHMFYVTLGNLGYYDTSGAGPQAGWGLTNSGPFSNLQPSWYWTETILPPNGGDPFAYTWDFKFNIGRQYFDDGSALSYAWAVHDGDIGLVPIPPALYLFAAGLLGLLGIYKRAPA